MSYDESLWDRATGAIGEAWDTGVAAVSQTWDTSVAAVSQTWDTSVAALEEGWDCGANAIEETWNWGTDIAEDAYDWTSDLLTDTGDAFASYDGAEGGASVSPYAQTGVKQAADDLTRQTLESLAEDEYWRLYYEGNLPEGVPTPDERWPPNPGGPSVGPMSDDERKRWDESHNPDGSPKLADPPDLGRSRGGGNDAIRWRNGGRVGQPLPPISPPGPGGAPMQPQPSNIAR